MSKDKQQPMSGEGKTAEERPDITRRVLEAFRDNRTQEDIAEAITRYILNRERLLSLTPNKGLSAEGIAMPAYFAGYANGSLPIEKALAFYKDWFKRNFPPKEQPVKLLTAEEQNSKQFDLGYSVACATFLQQYDQPTMVKSVYRENFCSIERLKEIGAEPGDIGTLWQIVHELSAPQEQKGGQE